MSLADAARSVVVVDVDPPAWLLVPADAEVDAEASAAWGEGAAELFALSAEADREAAVHVGGEDKHLLSIEHV